LFLIAAAASLACSADLCPPGQASPAGEVPGAVAWRSYRTEFRPGKFCIANEIRNEAKNPLEIVWKDAGVEHALVRGQLQMAECCFDGVAKSKSTLQYGGKSLEVTIERAAGEGLASHEEGYPDLIEEDARVRTVSIRGTLSAGGTDVRVDLLLKCSASQFAKQYAYQYSITDRSSDPVEVEWDLLAGMRKQAAPAVQVTPSGKTYLFLSDREPAEAEGRIEIRAKGGTVAALRLDGFAASK
jgi:hypothetical protein